MIHLVFFVIFFSLIHFSTASSTEKLTAYMETDELISEKKSSISILEDIREVDIKESSSQNSLNLNVSKDLYDTFLSVLALKINDPDSLTLQEPNFTKWSRRIAKGFAPIFGLTAGYTLFEPACAAPLRVLSVESPFLCYTFGISIVISWGSVVTWAGLRLANRIRSYSTDERVLEEKTTPKRNKLLTHIFSNLLGAMACIPGVYSVYKYNSRKWLVYPTTFIDYILKTEGCYTLINTIIAAIKNNPCSSSKKPNKNSVYADQIKQILISKLYPMLSDPQFNNTEIQDEALSAAKKLLNEDCTILNMDEPGKIAKYLRIGAQSSSLIFPLGQEFVRVGLTNEFLSRFIDTPYVRIPLSFLISIPSLSMTTLASTRTFGAIFDIIYGKCYSKKQPSFMSYFLPKTNYCIYSISTILAILSIAADVYIGYDVAANSSFPYLRYLIPVLTVMNIIIFQTFTLTSISQDISMEAVGTFGSNYLKQGVIIEQAYEFAYNMISNLNLFDFDDDDQIRLPDDDQVRLDDYKH